MVENMSYLIAPASGERIDVFGQGGGKRTAEANGHSVSGRARAGSGSSDRRAIADTP